MVDSLVETELETLRQENALLSSQVQRLVKTESQLYEAQKKLDQQVGIYQSLYELGKQLSNVT
ncbi:MAG: hypothetical protein AAFU53_06080, partial [Cyanobacteria bacterium J06632_3]